MAVQIHLYVKGNTHILYPPHRSATYINIAVQLHLHT
jgi:hypothetical protein